MDDKEYWDDDYFFKHQNDYHVPRNLRTGGASGAVGCGFSWSLVFIGLLFLSNPALGLILLCIGAIVIAAIIGNCKKGGADQNEDPEEEKRMGGLKNIHYLD